MLYSMFIVGHTVLAYLLVRPFLPGKKENIIAINLLILFLFANIIDYANIKFLRDIGHSLIGTSIITVIGLIVFHHFKILEKKLIPLILVAVISHVMADYLFSTYSFFLPFDYTKYLVFGYQIHYGLITESILTIIFIPAFLMTRDFQRLSNLVEKEKNNFLKNLDIKNIFSTKFLVFYVFLAFFLFIGVQLFLYFAVHLSCLMMGRIEVWTHTFLFIIFLFIFTFIANGRWSVVSKSLVTS